jgi:adenine-specific DNA-methyltransferase
MPTLDWLTRDEDLKRTGQVPYRLLEADPALSAGDSSSGNMLIQGDNLEALKSLLPYYAGQVKCIYIDPPYNTRSAFEHYDDNLEHSQWLAMIWPRLELLRELLADDGALWVNLDENEGHYFKVIGDEVFGRANFVRQITWQKKYSVSNNYKGIASLTDLIFVWRKSNAFQNNLLPRSVEAESRYTNPDDDPRGPWKAVDYLNQAAISQRPNLVYEIVNPITGEPVRNRVKAWKYDPATHAQHVSENRLWWGLEGENSVPALKLFLSEVRAGMTPHNWWPHIDVGHTDEAKKESIALIGRERAFATPKPERLLHRIVAISTQPGDLVLDSFLGSGTTAAVAHKMGRRWIGIEMGGHAVTHCAPRLRKVIDGEQGGISQAVGWRGGGGFDFYRLGEPVFDADGRIRAGIGFGSLAAHVWFSETGVALATPAMSTQGSSGEMDCRLRGNDGRSPFLGVREGRGYALLYNGMPGDGRPEGGNVLTSATLARIRESAGDFRGPLTVYGEASRLGEGRLRAEGITFRQTPYDLKAR